MNSATRSLLNLQALEFASGAADDLPLEEGAGVSRTIKRMRSRVSAQVLREYDTRKRRYGANSVVPVHDGCCSGCQVRLSLNTLRAARTRLMECEHCARLVYNPERRRRLRMEL